eukprot:309261-Chlamydomonas_euryale.AAC.3
MTSRDALGSIGWCDETPVSMPISGKPVMMELPWSCMRAGGWEACCMDGVAMRSFEKSIMMDVAWPCMHAGGGKGVGML